MKSTVRAIVTAMLLLIAGRAGAAEQIRWAADYRAACQLAADQNRLVLLHFYNDNCEPCVRLERNVFSQATVGDAVAANFVAVKVHAGQETQLANRYRVRSWPTDVFVTPSGLEVYRSISPQKPDDYIALVNQVAQQTGVGTGRNWSSKLGQAVAPAAAAGADAAGNVRQATEQVAVAGQDAVAQGQQRWSAALEQFKAASDQARLTTVQTGQQVDHRWRQTQEQATATGQQWSQQATDAAKVYEQQGGEALRQFRDQAGQITQHAQQQGKQFSQDIAGSALQATDAAAADVRSWQQTFSQATNDATSAGPAAAVAAAPSQSSDKPASTAPPLVPSDNPWMAARSADSQATIGSPAADAAQLNPSAPSAAAAATQVALQASAAPPQAPGPWTRAVAPEQSAAAVPQLAAPPPPATRPSTEPAARSSPPAFAPLTQQSPPAFTRPGQLVDASQAPPIAMDGFCPVTLLETVSRDPHDRGAWKKGNVKFGAIHRKRTYLFTSPENQQKFLANPDLYAPALDGCDPVVFAERGALVDGKRAYGLFTPDKRIYLFADEAALRKFNQSPAPYAAAAQQAMVREQGHFYR